MVSLIKGQFGDSVKVVVEPVDEYVDIYVELTHKIKSSNARIDRIASRIVNKAVSGK